MLTFRKANINDLDLFFKWVNDPSVRQTATNSKIISFEEHTLWFTKKIQDESCHIYVFENDMQPIGQVRFDKHNSIFLISYSISADYRGKGYGSKMLQQAIVNLFFTENNGYEALEGYIGSNNVASRKIFESIGFINSGEVRFSNRIFIHYSFLKNNIRIDHIIIGKDDDFQRLQNLDQVYDYIRMLDTKTNHNSLIPNEVKNLRFKFTKASIESGKLIAHLKVL